MKVATVSSAAAILILCCFAIPCVTAVGIPDIPIDTNQDEGEMQSPIETGVVNDGEKTPEKLNTSEVLGEFYFTKEEIEKNRIITIHWSGEEEVSTDEQVIQTLERVRRDNSTFLFNEPHFTEDLEKRHIIGSDNRYHRRSQGSAPYSAVGYLSTRCTAYLVGPRQLLTAAHCLHPHGNTGAIYRPSQVTFYLRRNCHTSGMTYTISDVLVYQQYRNSGDEDYDIACLLLSASVSNWMGFAYRDPMPTVSAEICGYPGDQIRGYPCFYCSRCSDVERVSTGWWGWSRSNTRLRYTCDTEGGMSGSPIITDDHDSTSNLYSYGVHTHGKTTRNEGVRISQNYFYDICRWMCDTGATCSVLC